MSDGVKMLLSTVIALAIMASAIFLFIKFPLHMVLIIIGTGILIGALLLILWLASFIYRTFFDD